MSEDILIRNAKDSDKCQISELLFKCFGSMAKDQGALSWIEGRYIVAVLHEDDAEKIVAISGISPPEKSMLNGYEITWTCTDERYRRRGLIARILSLCEDNLPDDHKPIYCDCWRIRDNEDINLIGVMNKLSFHEVIKNKGYFVRPHYKYCNDCPYNTDGCFCFTDLYIKER